MSFGDPVKLGFSNYANFSGRACRSEFWYWFLFVIIVEIIFGIVFNSIFIIALSEATIISDIFGIFRSIINLALFLPSLSVFVRRAHDLDCSGWWIVPFGGVFWSKGTDGPNRFGADRLADPGQVSPRPAHSQRPRTQWGVVILVLSAFALLAVGLYSSVSYLRRLVPSQGWWELRVA